MQEIRKAKIQQELLDAINQVFEIEKKASSLKEENSILRNVNKLKGLFEEGLFNNGGLTYYNPLGEAYTETRTDCIATIAGTSVDNLEIVEVIKPIIFYSYQESGRMLKTIVQPAVVVVQSQNS